MKLARTLLALMVLGMFGAVDAEERRSILTGSVTETTLRDIVLPLEHFRPFPKLTERDAWDSLPGKLRQRYIMAGESSLDFEWPNLPATTYLEFDRNGNRSNYQSIVNRLRRALTNLVMAEVVENRGRFLDQIANGVWATCEETSWVIPAHIGLQKAEGGLADVNEQVVDLFSAETGAALAWTYYLLGDRLAEVSPLIPSRILTEIDRRILTPNMERDNFWWMGFPDKVVNNWNPWINTNWLTCVLLAETDPDRRIAGIYKTMRSIENFLNHYPADGGCDEGPGYWNVAGGRLFDYLEFLRVASDGKIDHYDHPLIRNIGRFVYKAHIHEQYVVNFADASAKTRVSGEMVYRYGKRIDDLTMMAFGAWAVQQRDPVSRGISGNLSRQLFSMFELQEMYNAPAAQPYLRDAWLPDIQVMFARSKSGSPEGWFVAAKGGHNAESHNHNDVGSFVVYLDGYPALIDIGVETYTRKTFGRDRYDIWTMQSAYHNLPTINGVSQKAGRSFKSANISYEATDAFAELRQDISGAYPGEARIETWDRSVRLDRKTGVTLTDEFKLTAATEPLTFSLMTPYTVTITSSRINVSGKPHQEDKHLDFEIEFDPEKVTASVETIAIEDRQLTRTWGDTMHRILFTYKTTPLADKLAFRITRPQK